MSTSPQSQSVIDRLLRGERVTSGEVSIGPFGVDTKTLLQVLIDKASVLQRESGSMQAKKLRELFVAAQTARTGETDSDGGEAGARSKTTDRELAASLPEPVTTERPASDTKPAGWRLFRLSCRAIRGIDPSGEPLEFPFEGLPTLVFGPNGSGKSSLLGAIVWVLTGQIITDSDDNSEQAALYGLPRSGADRGSKLCEWPVVVSLPQSGSPAAVVPECSAQLELRSASGAALFVRRSLSAGLETSCDGVSWSRCTTLTEHGIEPLDLQLSLIASTVFGRLTIEQAHDTRSLLSLMLGYDDLEMIGDWATKLAGNRTRLANEEQRELDTRWTEIRQKLNVLPSVLPATCELRGQVSKIAAVQMPTKEAIAEIGQSTKQRIEVAEASLAELLGITEQGAAPSEGIADKLTTAIAALEKGVWINFPSLAMIRVEAALPEKVGTEPKSRLSKIVGEFEAFLLSAKNRISQRLEWWRKEIEPGSKAALRLRAAQAYDEASALCPVCEQSVKGLPVEAELTRLKTMDPELRHEVQTFFRNLHDELKSIVSDSLIALATSSPQDRCLRDWKDLCEATVGTAFKVVTATFHESVHQCVANTPSVPDIQLDILPGDAEDMFVAEAVEFVEITRKAQTSLAMLQWGETHLPELQQALDELITQSDGEDVTSLLAALSKGKQAAADVEPLARARSDLRTIYKIRESITAKEKEIAVLGALAASLDQLKLLAKYAANEVGTVFGSIRDSTVANWRLLYPETSSGLDPARLIMGKGRDKTVEALLGCGTYEVPGKFFANAGLQRAIALSFFFALLEKHPGGLGFVVMDDPILSLDDDHRESWSANILKPALEYLQVILATHQRQYLNHCKYDFCQCSVVELNPRSRSRRLSWRPGFRLDRAEEELQRAPTNAPNELRKYREELLCTLDAYSPAPFFNSGNLAQSLLDFCRLAAPHPLASRTQTRIVELLNDPEVARVLDPGSHHLTEADVTAAMSHQCLAKLRQCDTKLRDELDRLERLRAHERRGRALPAVAEGPLGVSDAAYWADPICIKALGRAAAKQDSWECDESEDATRLTLPPGAAVLAMADTLDPVVRPGQWLLIAAEDSAVLDGDLVVARVDGRRLLRRAWTDGANWHLASFNPVRPSKPVIAPRASATMRRIWGVLYEPIGLGGAGSYADGDEWQPRTDFDPAWVTTLHAITVEGSSLEPLARRGQKVLVASKQAPTETVIEQGGLAVLETSDESVGNVIKRVFRRKDRWVLVSPNPVEPQEPLVLLPAAVAAVWPMRGVLFESSVDGDAES